MRIAATLFAACVCLPASALDLATLAGNWVVDVDAFTAAMEKSEQFSAMPADQQQMMKGMMIPMMSQVAISLDANGMTMTDPMGKKEVLPATSFVSTGDKTGTIADPKGETTLITQQEDGTLAMAPENNDMGFSLILKRGAAPAAAATSPVKK